MFTTSNHNGLLRHIGLWTITVNTVCDVTRALKEIATRQVTFGPLSYNILEFGKISKIGKRRAHSKTQNALVSLGYSPLILTTNKSY